jgi:formate-dependent nitrite reductase membrane component NrfD
MGPANFAKHGDESQEGNRTMEQTRAKYNQLIGDLRSDLRPQREWCEGRGIFMVIGHFVVGVAGGTWLFSVYYGVRMGLALAFVLAVLGGLLHLANLGRPARAWKMMFQFRRSWISRGFYGLSFFLAGAFASLVPMFFPGVPWASGSAIAGIGNVLAFAGMLIMIGYMGFVYTASKGIPFWNSPLHPALYVAYALRGGIAGLLLTLAVNGQDFPSIANLLMLWIVITAVVIAFFGLEVHGALTTGNIAAQQSVHELFAGRVAIYFYGGTLLLGLAIPGWLVWTGLSGRLSLGAMALLGLASAFGDFFMKYSTIRAGVHLPVWTHLAPNERRTPKVPVSQIPAAE